MNPRSNWIPRIAHVAGLALSCSVFAAHAAAQTPPPPTFHESVAPLLQAHCVECHHDGGSAPFALESFEDAAGWSAQIGEVVSARRMPPWHADRSVGKFANDRSLPDAAIDAIVRWVAGGAKEGDRGKALPEAQRRQWPRGWSLAEPPDLVLTTAVVQVAAEGSLPYEYVRLPTNLAEDRWVCAAEVKSTNPQVVHHVLVFMEDSRRSRAGEDSRRSRAAAARPWRPVFNQFELLQGAKPNERPQWALRFQKLIANDLRYGEAGGLNGYFFSPLSGGGATRFADDEGKFLPAGSDLVFQVHHQPNGTAAASSTSIALWFADGPRAKALDTRGVATVVFTIPPGARDHEVRAEYRLPAAATLRSLQPHMHRRGKDFTFFAKLPERHDGGAGDPDGAAGGAGSGAINDEEMLLRVPAYDFNWQHEYVLAEPKRLPAGTVLRVVAHFDNSADNPNNPDPTQPVWFGLQTDEEMMIGYFEVVWDPSERDDGG